MPKGQDFERQICKTLSEWWTQDDTSPRQDVFWRTSNSGGRHTVRAKRGLTTANQVGDLCAVDPIGQPLCDLFVIEMKRGYNKHTLWDCLDKLKAKPELYEEWIRKLINQCGPNQSWLLIVKRDRRRSLILFPEGRFDTLHAYTRVDVDGVSVQVETLGRFLELVKPSVILDMWNATYDNSSVRRL